MKGFIELQQQYKKSFPWYYVFLLPTISGKKHVEQLVENSKLDRPLDTG